MFYWRACWHGYSDGWSAYLNLTMTDRYLCAEALDGMIKKSNAQGSGRPKDER